MNVVTLDPKASQREHRKEEMLEVLERMKELVENGEIDEFVACSQGTEHGLQIHVSCLDAVGGIGMFEVGKALLISHEFNSDE